MTTPCTFRISRNFCVSQFSELEEMFEIYLLLGLKKDFYII
jgi:hypothetical protein